MKIQLPVLPAALVSLFCNYSQITFAQTSFQSLLNFQTTSITPVPFLGGICAGDNNSIVAIRNGDPFQPGALDAGVVKLDSSGNLLWGNDYSFSYLYPLDSTPVSAIVSTPGGGHLVAARHFYTGQYYTNDLLLFSLDAYGTVTGAQIIAVADGEFLNTKQFFPTSDSAYLLIGSYGNMNPPPNNKGLFIIKVDAAGNILWSKVMNDVDPFSYGGASDSGGFIIGSNSYLTSTYIYKFNSSGVLLNQYYYGSASPGIVLPVGSSAPHVSRLPGTGYVFSMIVTSGINVYPLVFCLDDNFQFLWGRYFLAAASSLTSSETKNIILPDGNILLYYISGFNTELIKLDVTGNVLNKIDLPVGVYDVNAAIINNNVALCGFIFSQGAHILSCDASLNIGCSQPSTVADSLIALNISSVALTPASFSFPYNIVNPGSGSIAETSVAPYCTVPVQEHIMNTGIKIYYNHYSQTLHINSQSSEAFDHSSINITDLLGRKVMGQNNIQFPFAVNVSGLPEGIYTCFINISGNHGITQKIVIY